MISHTHRWEQKAGAEHISWEILQLMALPSTHLLPSSSAWHISSSDENFLESSVQYTWTVEVKCIESLNELNPQRDCTQFSQLRQVRDVSVGRECWILFLTVFHCSLFTGDIHLRSTCRPWMPQRRQAVESIVGRVLSRPAFIVKSKHYNEQLRARHIHKATTHGSDWMQAATSFSDFDCMLPHCGHWMTLMCMWR